MFWKKVKKSQPTYLLVFHRKTKSEHRTLKSLTCWVCICMSGYFDAGCLKKEAPTLLFAQLDVLAYHTFGIIRHLHTVCIFPWVQLCKKKAATWWLKSCLSSVVNSYQSIWQFVWINGFCDCEKLFLEVFLVAVTGTWRNRSKIHESLWWSKTLNAEDKRQSQQAYTNNDVT